MKKFSDFLKANIENIAFSESLFLFSISFFEITKEDLNYFCNRLKSNKNLKRIGFKMCDLYRCDLNILDQLFKAIQSLEALESLELINNFPEKKRNHGFLEIGSILKMSTLRDIDFSYNDLFNQDSISVTFFETIIKNNHFLKKIILVGNQVGTLSEIAFEKFCDALKSSNVEEIDLSSNAFFSLSENSFVKFLQSLSLMRSLKKLSLNSNNLSNKKLYFISNFLRNSNLESLDLSCCHLGEMKSSLEEWQVFFRGIFEKNTLKEFKISSNQLPAGFLDEDEDEPLEFDLPQFLSAHIEQWTSLERLDISNNEFYGRDIAIRSIARTLLIRNPKLGMHFSFSTPEIFKDFDSTGCEFDMRGLIEETQEYLEQKKLERTVDASLVSSHRARKPSR